MRRVAFFLTAGLLTLGVAASASAAPAAKATKAATKGAAGEPTTVDKKIKLNPDSVRFGMTIEELSKAYDKVLDDEWVPLYKSVEPGPRMNELDAELAERKLDILKNKVEFGSLPSGFENTALAGEYTANNGETMTHLRLRSGVERYFFFFGNHLWKVYDVQKLGKKSKLGEDFPAALGTLTTAFGKSPRTRKADPGQGRRFDQSDWQDKDTIVRVIDQANGKAGLAYIDRKIEENLGKYRTNKGEAAETLDREVSDVTRPVSPEAAKAGAPGGKKK